jgi:glycosyltransferase involved in cell wall biosynthesis
LNKKKYFKNNKINFLFVGQLIQRKGIKEILSAVNKLSHAEKEKILIHIVGDGNLKNTITKYKQKKAAIKYYGFVFGKKLSKIYQSSDVLLFPSKFDGWGVVPMEAMANCMSVVVSKNAGVSEMLNNKNNGFLIQPNSSALLKVIKKCIKNKKIIKRHGKNNRNLILKSICNADNLSNFFLNQIMKTV